jgi:predicted GNAT superfamily acetyltransferase
MSYSADGLPQDPGLPLADAATAAADAAAAASGVRIRELAGLAEMRRAAALAREIWRAGPASAPVTAELLRALGHSGNYVAGAFDGKQLAGLCTGFFAGPAGRSMHSHVAGVSPKLTGRSVGFALKLHQRAWALARGITTISWTFDPLISRNAYFNIAKLAAVPIEYLPDFYGPMDDGINAGDDSDRLLVRWRLAADVVGQACRGIPAAARTADLRAAGAVTALDLGAAGRPRSAGGAALTPIVLVRVPPDIESIRGSAPELARQWRRALRRVLGGLMAAGGRITGFDREGWYVVQRGKAPGLVADQAGPRAQWPQDRDSAGAQP